MGNLADVRQGRSADDPRIGGHYPPPWETVMNAEQNLAIVRDIYAAFGRGDLQAVLARVSDDCAEFSVISAGKTQVPWHLDTRGKRGAVSFFDALLGAVEFRAFEPRDYAAAGDHVYATLSMRVQVRATGELLEFAEVVHRFTLQNGMVVRWRATEDTFHTNQAFSRGGKGME
jgi:ketosteroid isomerase-like protein